MKKIILVVDDEPDIREMTKRVLELKGFKVLLAQDGADCIEKAKKNKVDLVLLDIMMPGLTTKEILPKIDAKVIFVSSVQMTSQEKEALFKSSNAKGYLAKPFDKDELIAKIKEVLK